MRVKFLAQWNNASLWWGLNLRWTDYKMRRATHSAIFNLVIKLTEVNMSCVFIEWEKYSVTIVMITHLAICLQLAADLTTDFLCEGWLTKKGPRNEPYRKRWFTLDRRKLMYQQDKLVCTLKRITQWQTCNKSCAAVKDSSFTGRLSSPGLCLQISSLYHFI